MQSVEIVEVGMHDGFQSIRTVIPTRTKIAFMEGLYAAGIRRLEATSFVSPAAVPQLADALEIMRAASGFSGLDALALVPNVHQADRAIRAGVHHLAFAFSASSRHSQSSLHRTPAESIDEFETILSRLPPDARLRVNITAAFDCPYFGRVSVDDMLACIEKVLASAPKAEVALCDTTGRATPDQVSHVFRHVQERHPDTSWAFRAHDTYGFGIANIHAAWSSGIRIFDTSIAGLGSCPFAPGAAGNVASEDVAWLFQSMGVQTGIDMESLLLIAHEVKALPDAVTGGRTREAMAARRRMAAA